MNIISRIIIVDDHPLFREGMRLLIEKEGMGQVIAEAENGLEFLDLLKQNEPDLVLMDIEMPFMNGIDATNRALTERPGLKILALTMLREREDYLAMLNAGAMGFVAKTAGKHELEKAIKTVTEGESFFPNEILRQIILSSGATRQISNNTKDGKLLLTEREHEVLRHFCEGMTASEISKKLFRSIKTIEAHRSKLLEKTGTKNTINLILFAIRNKLVDL